MSRLETSVQILSLLMMQSNGQLFPKKQKYFGGVRGVPPQFFRGGPLPRFSPIQCEVSGTSQLETTFENSCNNDGWVEVLMGLQTRLLF